MIRGLYTSAVSMQTQMHRMDITANNLANANTTGFKRDTAITQSFPEQLALRLNDPGIIVGRAEGLGMMSQGVLVSRVFTNFEQGSLESTGGALDLAIEGDGFFTVNYPINGEDSLKYTRNGNFTLTDDRFLVTVDGCRVQGQTGDIQLPDGMITIGQKGEIYVNDQLVDVLAMASFSDNESLRAFGYGMLDVTADTVAQPFMGEILQGHLEYSNVNIVQEMVDMITISRTYEASQRMISTQDTTLGKAVSDIASR